MPSAFGLGQNQNPYESSGYLMDEPQAIEITLCYEPAVSGAMFRVIRSTDGGNRQNKIQMPANVKSAKQQVMGYVSIPWLEDYYGDVMDPTAVEHACNSFMKNLSLGNVLGNGVGEEHSEFWHNAHVIQSCIDTNGGIGGIPGGWWIAVQVTDPTTWQKIVQGGYTGFSLQSNVLWTNTTRPETQANIFKSIPKKMASVEQAKPLKGSHYFANPGDFGFPTEAASYADPSNNRLPIDTRSRAYATLRYIVQNYEDEGYTINELKYVVRRMIAAISTYGDEIPDETMQAVGFRSRQSIIDFAGEAGIKKQSVQEEENTMPTNGLTPEMLDAFRGIAQDAVKAATAEQGVLLNSIAQSLGINNQSSQDHNGEKKNGCDGQNSDSSNNQSSTEPTKKPVDDGSEDDSNKENKENKENKSNKDQSVSEDMVANIVRQVLAQQQSQSQTQQQSQPQSVTPADLTAALAAFANTLTKGMAESNQSVMNALQSVSDRIAAMPVPRATALQSMRQNQSKRSEFLNLMKQKIDSGLDYTAEEGAMAEALGVNFDADDPFKGLTF